MEADIKKSFLRWKPLPGSVPSEITTPKETRKLPVKLQVTIKSTPKKTQKTSPLITSPVALFLINYGEPMTKDVGTQTGNTLLNYWTIIIHFIILIAVKTY